MRTAFAHLEPWPIAIAKRPRVKEDTARLFSEAVHLPPEGSTYRRPPITEAVIEVRFGDRIEPDDLNRVNQAMAQHYATEQQLDEIQFALTVQPGSPPTSQATVTERFFHRADADQREIVLLKPFGLAVSDLAPYSGWDQFFPRFRRDWTVWKDTLGYRKISRVGMRYINRIDIPIQPGLDTIRHSDYITVYVESSEAAFGPMVSYTAKAIFPLLAIGGRWLMQTAVLSDPPVPGYISFLVDLDLSREVDPPQRDDGLFDLLATMRTEKNRLFEQCITDKARELFR